MLRNLRSLVVKNHNISSRGVRPLVQLSALTRLELSGQVESAVDMSGIRNMSSMPSFLFDFMSESLEELYFEGTSVDGLDPIILKAAPRLRVLDLGNTMVSYISPLFLLLSRRLEILNVKGAPVALSLNWNTSSLGAGYAKILRNDPPEMVDADDLAPLHAPALAHGMQAGADGEDHVRVGPELPPLPHAHAPGVVRPHHAAALKMAGDRRAQPARQGHELLAAVERARADPDQRGLGAGQHPGCAGDQLRLSGAGGGGDAAAFLPMSVFAATLCAAVDSFTGGRSESALREEALSWCFRCCWRTC